MDDARDARWGLEALEWWREAKSEHNQIKRAVLRLVPVSQLPPGARVVKNKWVFKIKTDDLNMIKRFKVRGVGRGDMQKEGRDYHQGYFPVGKASTWRRQLFKAAKKK